MNGLAPESFYVEILQPSADKLVLHQTLVDGRGVRVQHFDQNLGDFSCKDGYVFIKPYLRQQTGVYVSREDKFTRTDGGALIYHEKIKNQRSEMLIFSTSSMVHYWYRFRPVAVK